MVSVIIPTYNRADKIEKSITSVINQTYKDIEIIVVDDGSTDSTEKVVKKINDTRINYVKQKNSGACIARNYGIELSKGEYIAFHDSDDVWHINKLEKQLKIIETTGADLVCCKMLRIKKNNKKKTYPSKLKEGFLNNNANLFGIGTQTLLAKSKVFKNIMFDPKMPRYQDFELLLRITNTYKVYYIDDVLVDYNIGDDSISVNPEKLQNACELILEKNPDFIKTYPKMSKTMSCNLLTGAYIAKKNDPELYKKMLKYSIKISKSLKTITKCILIMLNIYKQ